MHNKSAFHQGSNGRFEKKHYILSPVSIIIPFRAYCSRSRDLLRLRRLLIAVPSELEIVVADDSSNENIRQLVCRLVKSRTNSIYVNCFAEHDSIFSIGKLRDAGAKAATAKVVLFHDVDFIAANHIYRKIAFGMLLEQLDKKGNSAFCCIPVLFTSPAGWPLRRLLKFTLMSSVGRKYLRSPIGLWAGRLVLGSSAILVNRVHYLDIGGHSNIFGGHGAEDFELLNRLSAVYRIGKRPKNYPQDCGTLGFESSGFREYFSRYGRQAAAQNIILLHQWHPRRKQDKKYVQARGENFQRLYAVLSKEH
jgi:predicted glycosyltransferase involved in capsule biosynthesis